MDDGIKNTPNEFDEYLRQGEPQKRERAEAWGVAIGLQAVDGLTPSAYLVETAKRHIEGDISIDEVRELIDTYYRTKSAHDATDDGKEEADKVSSNITKLLNEKTFSFSPVGYAAVHERVFEGVFKFAGKFREYNLTKREWVLRGDTVLYVGFDEIRRALDHDFDREREFVYKGLSLTEMIAHIAKFVSGIWQIHAFREGNTRATAVFTIKYLRAMGFDVDIGLFREHSWYFRNALVRANYRNVQKGIEPDPEFLERFFRNLLAGEQNELKNRFMPIDPPEQLADKHPTSTRQVPDKLTPPNESICNLVRIIGDRQLSVRELLSEMGLKNRENFLDNYLNPAITGGWVKLLYPDSPRHPRQKYLLTAKALAFIKSAE